ncbi:TetR family transcriptional regulator C-terminal domain-containing protein [Cohnella herbarum]|uniref:TetR family transcriptional regulator C-terminal domain-containing protein n=1 Tax=Cohnella herbarum TaxID=2728023 RepID=UPI004046B39F
MLRNQALEAYEQMLSFIKSLLARGVDTGEFRPDMDLESTASFIFSSIEGGIMASRLTRDNKHVGFATNQIERWLATFKSV